MAAKFLKTLKAEIKRIAPEGVDLPRINYDTHILTFTWPDGKEFPLAYDGTENDLAVAAYARNIWETYKNG